MLKRSLISAGSLVASALIDMLTDRPQVVLTRRIPVQSFSESGLKGHHYWQAYSSKDLPFAGVRECDMKATFGSLNEVPGTIEWDAK